MEGSEHMIDLAESKLFTPIKNPDNGVTAYLLTYSASKAFFKADKHAMDTVMKSFKWVR